MRGKMKRRVDRAGISTGFGGVSEGNVYVCLGEAEPRTRFGSSEQDGDVVPLEGRVMGD